ncbi:hypothetical protein Tco_1277473 [Tanacetum coccineum]
MMASTDEDVEKSSLIDQDVIGSGVSVYGYASTLLSERVTPSSRSSKSGDHQHSRCNIPEYDRHDGPRCDDMAQAYKPAILLLRDVSLYLLGGMRETWTLLDLLSSD